VPEVILARHCGLDVVALSVITNLAEGLGPRALSHGETLAVAGKAAGDLARLIAGFCAELRRRGLHHGGTEDTEQKA
jgi:purine nucleoside phosphorylase